MIKYQARNEKQINEIEILINKTEDMDSEGISVYHKGTSWDVPCFF